MCSCVADNGTGSSSQIGEFATDYIEVRRDYTDWTPPYHPKDEIEPETPPAAGDRHGVPDVQRGGMNGAANGEPKAAVVNGALPSISEKPEAANGNGATIP